MRRFLHGSELVPGPSTSCIARARFGGGGRTRGPAQSQLLTSRATPEPVPEVQVNGSTGLFSIIFVDDERPVVTGLDFCGKNRGEGGRTCDAEFGRLLGPPTQTQAQGTLVAVAAMSPSLPGGDAGHDWDLRFTAFCSTFRMLRQVID
jgi:hypothetical protein